MTKIEKIRLETDSLTVGKISKTVPIAEFDLRELFRILWRRKAIILGTTISVTAFALIFILQLVPRYTATADILINPRTTQVVNMEAVLSGLSGDFEMMESEIEVLKSRSLAAKSIEALKLGENPDFNESLREPGRFQKFMNVRTYIPDFVLDMFKKPAKTGLLSANELAQRKQEGLTDFFLGGLGVQQIGYSRVIRVTFTSINPKIAAAAVNQLSEFYIVSQLEAKFEATKRASQWLGDRLTTLRTQVSEGDNAVETFRAKSGLIRGRSVRLTNEEVSVVNAQLLEVRIKKAAAVSKLQQVDTQIKAGIGVNMASELITSDHFEELRLRLADAEKLVAELSVRYRELHPTLIKARADLENTKRNLASEADAVIRSLYDEVAATKIQEDALQARLTGLKQDIASLNSAEVTLRSLESEAQANHKLFEIFLERFKETSSQEDFQKADASVLSVAAIPIGKSYPKTRLMAIAAFVAAVIIGLVLAFTVEQLDSGFRSMEQIEQKTGLSAMGLIPSLSVFKKLGSSPASYIQKNPTSAYGESIRSLHTNLLLSNVDSPPKSILIASSVPGEGKTSVAISLACMLAGAGQNVTLVDCDFRRASVGKVLGMSARPGLTEYLAGKAQLEDVIRVDPQSKINLITAGAPVPNPADLLGSEQMKKLLDALAKISDMVIVDSAPVTAVSDTLILSRLVDKTVYLVRWVDTDRKRAVAGMKLIKDAGADVAGVLLTMVDVRKHAGYGYSDSGYYYGRSRKYYTG